MAKRIVLHKTGGPERLQVEDFELGPLADGKVRIAVEYAGINWADVMMRLGLYPDAPSKPFTPGYEVAGTVLQAPAGSGLRVGHRVAAGTRFGGYSSVVDVSPQQVMKVPAKIALDEAAAMPVVYMTSWVALHESARVRSGEKVLIHGGAGGVGLAAIGLAKQAGCEVYATAGGPDKVAFLEEEMDIDGAFDYRAAPWTDQVKAAVPDGFDTIIDPIGGDHLKQSLRALALGGRVVALGASATAAKGKFSPVQAVRTIRQMRLSAIGLMMHSTGILGLNMLHYMNGHEERLGNELEHLMKAMSKGSLTRPRIAATFDLDEAPAAHQYLHDRRNIGKVLLRMPQS